MPKLSGHGHLLPWTGTGGVLIDGCAGVVCSRGIGMAWLLLRREPGFMPRLLGGGEVVG